jgi:hypothetical protein
MREITQRQLGNVSELSPICRRRFVPAEVAIAAFSGLGDIDYKQFRADVDRFVDQDPTPRA